MFLIKCFKILLITFISIRIGILKIEVIRSHGGFVQDLITTTPVYKDILYQIFITCASICSLERSSRFRILYSSKPWMSSFPDLLLISDEIEPWRCLIPNPLGGRPESNWPENLRVRVRPRLTSEWGFVRPEQVDIESKLCRSKIWLRILLACSK